MTFNLVDFDAVLYANDSGDGRRGWSRMWLGVDDRGDGYMKGAGHGWFFSASGDGFSFRLFQQRDGKDDHLLTTIFLEQNYQLKGQNT